MIFFLIFRKCWLKSFIETTLFLLDIIIIIYGKS